jgi:hypothetical protein
MRDVSADATNDQNRKRLQTTLHVASPLIPLIEQVWQLGDVARYASRFIKHQRLLNTCGTCAFWLASA